MATGVPVLAATLRCRRERASRVAVPRRVLRAFGGAACGCITTGGSVWLGLSACAQPSVDKTRQENATEQRNAQRCRGGTIVREVINKLAITWHVTANAVWPLPQEEDGSTPTRTPRPMCSRVTTTDGRSPGSRVVACRRLPRPAGPVALGEGSPLTVAGAATALREIPAPYSLLISRRRTVVFTLVLFEKGCQPGVPLRQKSARRADRRAKDPARTHEDAVVREVSIAHHVETNMESASAPLAARYPGD
jgi:hypothetical protein